MSAKPVVQYIFRGRLVRFEGDGMLLRQLQENERDEPGYLASVLGELFEKNGAFPGVVHVS